VLQGSQSHARHAFSFPRADCRQSSKRCECANPLLLPPRQGLRKACWQRAAQLNEGRCADTAREGALSGGWLPGGALAPLWSRERKRRGEHGNGCALRPWPRKTSALLRGGEGGKRGMSATRSPTTRDSGEWVVNGVEPTRGHSSRRRRRRR
jgi:hypothetical protein